MCYTAGVSIGENFSTAVRDNDVFIVETKYGVDTFIEVGPGKTLTGLIKRMDETVKPYRMSEYGDIEEIKQGVLSC